MPTDDLQNYFAQKGKLLHFKRGEVIVQPGDLPSDVFLLKNGLVTAYSTDKSGARHLHMFLRPGKVFPLMRSLLQRTNQICCVAKTDVDVYSVTTKALREEIETNAQLTKALLYQSVSSFGVTTNRIENLQYSSARERILYRLLTLAKSFGKPYGDGLKLAIEISHEELASSVQVSREVVTRTMRRLRDDQIVDYSRNNITIYPLKALRALHDKNLTLSDFGLGEFAAT